MRIHEGFHEGRKGCSGQPFLRYKEACHQDKEAPAEPRLLPAIAFAVVFLLRCSLGGDSLKKGDVLPFLIGRAV